MAREQEGYREMVQFLYENSGGKMFFNRCDIAKLCGISRTTAATFFGAKEAKIPIGKLAKKLLT